MKIVIQGGHLIDPAQQIDAVTDVFIAASKVVGIGQAPAEFHANKVIDARGLTVCPGLVDLSARLREPGSEHKATLHSEMSAAMAGGVTSIVCQPDTDPVLDEPGLVEMLKFRARNQHMAHVYPLGALTVGLKGEVLTEMAELTESGCVGFTQTEHPITDTNVLLRAMQYANTFGYTVWLRPQDAWLGKGGVAASGALASRMGLSGVPVAGETVALHVIFELMRLTGARVHLCRLSSAAGVALVAAAKREGLPVTCDVGVHHLHLIDTDIGFFNPQMRLTPPLRSGRDREALWAGVLDGTIDAICSDHTPVDDDEKLLPFAEATPGATGFEVFLPLLLKWASEQKVSTSTALSKVLRAPAGILSRQQDATLGTLKVGAVADVCVFDAQAEWLVQADKLKSQGKNSPFLGLPLQGQVKLTMVAGHIAFDTLPHIAHSH